MSAAAPFSEKLNSYFTCLKWVSHSNTALRALRLGGSHILALTLILHPLWWRSLGSQLADFHFVVIIPLSNKPAISFIDYYSSYPTNCISGSMIENWHKTRIFSFIMITNMDWQFDLFSIPFNIIRCEFLHIHSHCKRINEAKILLFA